LGAVAMIDRVAERRPIPMPAIAVCCALLFVLPAAQSRSVFATLTDDHWASAEDWLDENVPEGSKVAVGDYSLYIEPGRYEMVPVPGLISHDISWYRDQDFDLVVAGEPHFRRFLADPVRYPQAALYEDFLDQACLLHATGPPGARVLLLSPDPCDD
jgi:hypothetical protein